MALDVFLGLFCIGREGCTVGNPVRSGRLHGREHRTMIRLFLDFHSISREYCMVGKAAWSATLHGRESGTTPFIQTAYVRNRNLPSPWPVYGIFVPVVKPTNSSESNKTITYS